MSIFDKLFGRSPSPKNKMQEAITALRSEVVEAAEVKLGRTLSNKEMKGIENIDSLMMLESWCRSFLHESTSTGDIEKSLKSFFHETEDK